jgi:hypothetical protein
MEKSDLWVPRKDSMVSVDTSTTLPKKKEIKLVSTHDHDDCLLSVRSTNDPEVPDKISAGVIGRFRTYV